VAALAVLAVAVLITVMMAAVAVAMRRNDAAIDAHLARATATVLTVSPLRTGIEFVTEDGTTVRPPDGVLYPGLLATGQKFIVEYSTADPDLVRVAGRTAAVGNLMVAAVLVVTWLIAGPLAYLLHRRSGLPLVGRRPPPAAPDPPSVSLGGRDAD
jgi:hypothetical protein